MTPTEIILLTGRIEAVFPDDYGRFVIEVTPDEFDALYNHMDELIHEPRLRDPAMSRLVSAMKVRGVWVQRKRFK